MFGAGGIGADKWQIYLRFQNCGKLNFGFFRRLCQALQCLFVIAQVNAVSLLKFDRQPFRHFFVEVAATQLSIAGCGAHFKDIIAHIQHGNVQSSAA